MKAFLSHSSKDKNYVREVANHLGAGRCEFDEATFESTLNVAAIHKALQRCDLFVLFLSKDSLESQFVAEEQKFTRELRGRGIIKKILIFALDDSTYRSLPSWLRDYNVCHKVSSPQICARRINSILVRLEAEEASLAEIYIERSDQEQELRTAVSAPTDKAPTTVHIVGYEGVGRRTLLQKTFDKIFPGQIEVYLPVTVQSNHGLDDIYRSLCAYHKTGSLSEISQDFLRFSNLSDSDKAQEIADTILELCEDRALVLFIDDGGGVFDDSGSYHDHVRGIINRLKGRVRPSLAVIQTRMMPYRQRFEDGKTFHLYVPPLNEAEAMQLLSFLLKQRGIDFTSSQLHSLSELVDGHPLNARFAAGYAKIYGLNLLLAEPDELISWKRKKAQDFLRKIIFADIETNILAALVDFRFLATETIFGIIDAPQSEIAQSLRKLEEYCCVERRGDYFHISLPVRAGVERDERFQKTSEWRRGIAERIASLVQNYTDEDKFPIAILDNAIAAAAQISDTNPFLSQLILPSHLLRIARDCYDGNRRLECMNFAKRAYSMKSQLPADARVEVLRLWGLSAIRLNQRAELDSVYFELQRQASPAAARMKYFLQGFWARLHNKIDEAEGFFLKAHEMNKDNPSINREIAGLYYRQGRYDEAEAFARRALSHNPTNPFILDVLLSSLLAKLLRGIAANEDEIRRLTDDLKTYGDAPGYSFYSIREAERLARNPSTRRQALRHAEEAVKKTPHLLSAHLCRANIKLRLNDINGAENDYATIKKMAEQGGIGDIEEFQITELEISLAIEKRSFGFARDLLAERSLPAYVRRRLIKKLVSVIAYDPTSVSDEMKEWAKRNSN
ncbi:MAG: TIR domain-containing protein [Ferrovibrio sp.]